MGEPVTESRPGRAELPIGDEMRAIPVDNPVRKSAAKVVEPPVDPQLEVLPRT